VVARPVLSAPAFVRRDGTVLADAWLPDLVRLRALEAHLKQTSLASDAATVLGPRSARQPGAGR
jgi:hypothetical protein